MKIVVSYRRSDSAGIAGRIFDRLAAHYGHDSVFMDVDNIPFGIDFREYIRAALFDCDVLIVIVGRQWVGERPEGKSRINDETDPVRVEVEAALERQIPIIPVLVDAAAMPDPAKLPDSLRDFAFRNAAQVDSGRDFHHHVDRLIRSMDRLLAGRIVGPASERVTTGREPGIVRPAPSRGPGSRKLLSGRSVFWLAIFGTISAASAGLVWMMLERAPTQPSSAPTQASSPPAQPSPTPIQPSSTPVPRFSSASPITIGVAGPMTGAIASFGRQFKNGVDLAVADINAAGGVLGKQLKLEVADDACDPKQAIAVAEKLVALKLPFVAGHFCSAASIAASNVYADGDILQVTPGSTNPTFTERGLWNTFRTCGRDDQQGTFIGIYLAKKYASKNIAIIHDKTVYGNGLADQTKKALNNTGIKEKLFDSFARGDKDFSGLVAKLKAAAIDVVVLGGFHTEAALILRQMRGQGMKAQMIAGDTVADTEFWSLAGPAGEGMQFTFGLDARKKVSAAALVQRFRSKGIDPEGATLYAYAAVQVWAQAADEGNSAEARRVAATMKFGRWDTILGSVSYDAKGDNSLLDYVINTWKKDGTYSE